LEAKITAELGIESELIRGDNGIFDVVVDGELVFSKGATGRFPLEDEIIELLRARN
jgi:selT/selW/selH-like putative selenoprotein